MKVEYGKGYVPSDCQAKSNLPSNSISLDASFSPVLSVCYKAESSRVGHVTDFDRLVLDIITNGTISPKDAVSVAAKILQDQLMEIGKKVYSANQTPTQQPSSKQTTNNNDSVIDADFSETK